MRGFAVIFLLIAMVCSGCVSKSNGADKSVENIVCQNVEETNSINIEDSAAVLVNEKPLVREIGRASCRERVFLPV